MTKTFRLVPFICLLCLSVMLFCSCDGASDGWKIVRLTGEEKTVQIVIGPKSMRTLDEHYVWNIEPGKFTVYLGENCEKILFEQDFLVE